MFKILIIGRPNVGKSSLFNRLLGRRRAIVDAEAGITRDPISELIQVAGKKCLLTDTAGLAESENFLDSQIAEKSIGLIVRADIILVMLDVMEFNSHDEELIQKIRPYSDRVIILLNKVDTEARMQHAHEFYQLGFDTLLTISAAHNIGIEDLYEELEKRLDRETEQNQAYEEVMVSESSRESLPSTVPPTILVLGQPNTGKSTLCNLLCEGEQSIVSDIPGTTRDLLKRRFYLEGQKFQLLDSAGIRRKGKIQNNVEYYSVNRAIAGIDEADVVLLLIDAKKGFSEQDKKISAQVVKRGRGLILVLNKWDLLPQIANQIEAMRDRLQFLFPVLGFAPILPLSAKTSFGLKNILSTTLELRKQLSTRIPTPILNKELLHWKQIHPPPVRKNFSFKVKYIVQVSICPSNFILFVNRKTGFPESYLSYIRNQVRSRFKIDKIPLHFEVRLSGKN